MKYSIDEYADRMTAPIGAVRITPQRVRITFRYPKFGLNGGWTTAEAIVDKDKVQRTLQTIKNEGYYLISIEDIA
jgi:hypothetical protein